MDSVYGLKIIIVNKHNNFKRISKLSAAVAILYYIKVLPQLIQ